MDKITDKQALSALESLDDYARMELGVDPTGPYKTLKAFIFQNATTKELGNMTRSDLDADE